MSKYGGYGDIHNQAKNKDWQLEYKQKSKSSSSSAEHRPMAPLPEGSVREILKDIVDFRSEEQKARDKAEKIQKQKEKNSVENHLYHGNVIQLNDTPLDGNGRKLTGNVTAKNMVFSYKSCAIDEELIKSPYKYNINGDIFTKRRDLWHSWLRCLKAYIPKDAK